MSSKPVIEICLPGVVSALCKVLCKTGAKIPEINDDFPEPETPLTAVIQPSGKSTFTDCRLL